MAPRAPTESSANVTIVANASSEPSLATSGARANEVEERRLALRKIAWVGALAWPVFVVTDFIDAALTHRPEILAPLLAIRASGIVIAAILLRVLGKAGLSSRRLAIADLVCFTSFSFLVSLEAVLIGGFEVQVTLGIMIIAFMRASLLPSHWLRAFSVASLTVLVLPLTVLVISIWNLHVRSEWLAPDRIPPMAYALGHILGGVAIGSAGSHMVWSARRQVFEARKLGQYRLKARIGSGGSGDVWLARQDKLDRDVALKVLRARGRDDESLRRRFAREAKAASALRHPNTIRVIEYGASDDGVCFMAMELLDGVDLDKLVTRSGPLPSPRAVHFALQACGSLAEAHAAGIVHRDIKPANLFVTRVGGEESFLKLLDFGVAHVMEADHSVTMTEMGMVVGTPAYMAPEACGGERADARSDLYSLGAVLYFMLTGTELFPNKSLTETLLAHLNQAPQPMGERLRAKGITVSAELEAIVMRCLAKDPADRFATAHDLEDALRAHAAESFEEARTTARSSISASRASIRTSSA